MKRRNLKTLALNSCKISELQAINGGFNQLDTALTNVSCGSCNPTCLQPPTMKCDQ
jgi:hypothetical protein